MKYLLLLIIAISSLDAHAVSYIYFQNNSSLSFNVSSSQTGTEIMDPGDWWGMNGTVNPWQLNTNVLWSNRDSGITNGEDFYLTATLTSGAESINLNMHLNGNFVGSDMWQSLDGPGFTHSWYGDNSFHEETFTLDGKLVTVKYSAYFTGGDDDILFVIQEHDPFPILAADLADEDVLNVLSYNIYMLTPPIAFTDQETRANYIHENTHDYDVIIINEAFYNDARTTLTSKLSLEYPYNTGVVDEAGSLEDGGVIIYSRWPIEFSADMVYTACDNDDCLAAKGAMYAKVNKLGTYYHVFGTHTQAWADPQNVVTRQAQMTELKNFVDSYLIPSDEAVIYGGDFNVEKGANFMNEYTDMFTFLNSSEPQYIGQPYTYDYEVSAYAESPYQEYLDYLMVENSHRSPDLVTNKVVVLRSIEDPMWDIFDLSDHLAVQGRFTFPDPSISVSENDWTSNVFVSPNPTNELLTIHGLSSELIDSKFRITNVLGEEFEVSELNQDQLNVSSLPNGVYFLSVIVEGRVEVIRWIKE